MRIFIFFFLIYILTSGGHLYSLDEENLFMVTRAMVESRDFRMEDGNFSPYGLGPSFFAAPLYILGKMLSIVTRSLNETEITRGMCSTFNSFVIAITCAVLFNLLRLFSIPVKTSFLTVLLYGIGSLAWPYSKYFFPQPLVSLFLLLAIFCLFQFNFKKEKVWLIRAGLWTGFAIFTRFEGFLFYPLGMGYILYGRKNKLLNFIYFSIFPLVFFIFFLIYNYIRSGAYLNPGYGNYAADYSTPIFLGLYGNLFSPGKGLLVYVPAVLLSFIGLRFFRYKREAIFISLVVIVYLILFSKWWDWSGDWSWGPRLLVAILPLFFIPIGFLLEKIKLKSIPGVCILIISVLSIIAQIISLPVSFNEYLRQVYRQPEARINFMGSEINIRPHHFIPRLSPLNAQVALIKERLKTIRKADSVHGYDYHGREITSPIFDFWYINLLKKASALKNYVLLLAGFIFAGWILTLYSIIHMVK